MSLFVRVNRKINSILYRDCIKIRYDVSKEELDIYCPKSYEDRSVKTVQMFMQAFEYAKPQIRKSFSLVISFDDYYDKSRKAFAYCKSDDMDNVILIPDFCFLNWKESGMLDYEDTCNALMEASRKEPLYDKLFWIGNTATHPTRKVLCDIASRDKRIEAYGMNWVDENGVPGPTKFVSLVDHAQYKYLIDIQGRGYSGRTKMLMFSGRPLFIADRKWHEYWYKDINPFVHYIPVKEDLSDLAEKLDWAWNNPDEAKKIAVNAQEYARSSLRRENAIEYLTRVIVEYANG